MFKRSRKKIILSIMGSMILLFAVTLSVIMFASYRELRKKSADILNDYIDAHSLEQVSKEPAMSGNPGGSESPSGSGNLGGSGSPSGSGNPGGSESLSGSGNPGVSGSSVASGSPEPGPQKMDHPIDNRDFQLSTFYSVSFAEDGSVLDVDSGMTGIYSDEDLIGIAEDIREKALISGQRDMLLFRTVIKDGYTLVAFMDNTVTDSNMHTLIRYVLIVGVTAIAAMFVISLFLSKRIIQPLEENDQKQKQFISDASHELKTPVAVIGANAEMLTREIGENEWLSNIQYENERMGELVAQLLDLSRAENTDAPMEHVDFSRIVTGEVLAFESLAFDKGKTIQSDIEDYVHLAGRQAQLSQLVSVLLDNAITHSTGNDIEVTLSRHAYKAILRVRNEGKEIPAEKQEHLFDRFYQLDEARSSEGRHYGLGLSIARAVAERHGGSIDVSCHEGKVEFAVFLPII